MKKLLFVGLLFIAARAHAATNSFLVPSDVNGVSDPRLKSAGVNKLVLVTSTNAALATDIDGNTIASGFIHYVILPSSVTIGASTFLVMRDTNTANLTSTLLAPYLWSVGTGTGGNVSSPIVNFDPPIPFTNGLSLNLGAAGSTPATGGGWGVGVRWKRRQ